MAEMPRGKPRSVLDLLGDEVEAAHRRDRLQREKAEDAAALQRSMRSAFQRLPFEERSAALELNAQSEPTITRLKQTYRAVDNGRAIKLVPVDNPLVTPAVRAEQRRAIERANFAARNPMGGALDGAAAFLGVGEARRDPLLFGGAALDSLASGFASRGGAHRQATPSPPRPLPRDQFDLGAVRFGRLTPAGQATGMNATVRKEMLGTGTTVARRMVTPGLHQGLDRAHLLGRQLGGRGDINENLVTATPSPTNKSFMQSFENGVARMVRNGEFVDYSVTPLYGRDALPPRFVMMTARGSHGSQAARVVENPAGRPK